MVSPSVLQPDAPLHQPQPRVPLVCPAAKCLDMKEIFKTTPIPTYYCSGAPTRPGKETAVRNTESESETMKGTYLPTYLPRYIGNV